jgi:thymidylate synthase (FAD)
MIQLLLGEIMRKITILPQTTKDPLQLIGITSAVCYNADTSDKEKNKKRALDCIYSGHGRVLEWPNIELIVEGFSAKMMREAMRHIVGTSVLQASTRYIDYEKGFSVVTPPSIEKNNDAAEAWYKAISDIKAAMSILKSLGVPKEDYTNLLPLAYESKMIWKLNLRALIHFFNQRKCYRSYHEIRDFCDELINQLANYSEQWSFICKELFVPKCEQYRSINEDFCFCTEAKGCGRHPNIKNLKIIKNN